jgi:CBS domain-containing protein
MSVQKILTQKGTQVYSVLPSITVYEALLQMSEKNIGAILVIEDGILKGILSERDYARKVALKAKSSKETFVHEIMASDVITVKPEDKIDYCMELMYTKKVRHLPVVDNEKVIGIVSIGDVVKGVIDRQKEIIEHLDNYING